MIINIWCRGWEWNRFELLSYKGEKTFYKSNNFNQNLIMKFPNCIPLLASSARPGKGITMVSVSTVQPSLNQEFLCTLKQQMSLYILNIKDNIYNMKVYLNDDNTHVDSRPHKNILWGLKAHSGMHKKGSCISFSRAKAHRYNSPTHSLIFQGLGFQANWVRLVGLLDS